MLLVSSALNALQLLIAIQIVKVVTAGGKISADTDTPLYLNLRLYGSVPPPLESWNEEK